MANDFRKRYQRGTSRGTFSPRQVLKKESVLSDDIMHDNIDGDVVDDKAGNAMRLLAWGFDSCLILVLLYNIFHNSSSSLNPDNIAAAIMLKNDWKAAVGFSDGMIFNFIAAFFWCVYYFIAITIYATLLETSPLRATLGKAMLGIYVVDSSQEKCDFVNALTRNLAKIFSILLCFSGCLAAFFIKDNRTFHDILSNCRVKTNFEVSDNRRTFCTVICAFFVSVISTVIAIKYSTGMDALPADVAEAVAEMRENREIQLARENEEREKALLAEAPKKDLGYVTFNGTQVQFHDIFIRFKAGDKTTQLEGVLFEEALTKDDISYLRRLTDLAAHTKSSIGKTPLMFVNLEYDNTTMFCDPSNIFNAFFKLTPQIMGGKYAASNDKVEFVKNYRQVNATQKLSTSCKGLAADNEFFLSYADKKLLKGNNVEMDVHFNTDLKEYIALENISYTSAKTAIAIYKTNSSKLLVNLYSQKLSAAQIRAIQSAGGGWQEKTLARPDIAVEIPLQIPQLPNVNNQKLLKELQRKRLQVSGNTIKNGYTVRIFRRSVKDVPYSKDDSSSFTVQYKSGERPSVSGQLVSGQQIRGRISGNKALTTKLGTVHVEWSVPFSAPLYTIP